MPSGETEVIFNPNVEKKIEYVDQTYDGNLIHSNCSQIPIVSNISYIDAEGNDVNVEHEAIGNKAIAFVGTSGVQMGWLASQADRLAEDWRVVE